MRKNTRGVEDCTWINQNPCFYSPIIAEKTLKTEKMLGLLYSVGIQASCCGQDANFWPRTCDRESSVVWSIPWCTDDISKKRKLVVQTPHLSRTRVPGPMVTREARSQVIRSHVCYNADQVSFRPGCGLYLLADVDHFGDVAILPQDQRPARPNSPETFPVLEPQRERSIIS
jgi:hypothetical protein